MGFKQHFIHIAKEYKKDPKGQCKKQLKNILAIHWELGKTTKKEVLEYVTKWAGE